MNTAATEIEKLRRQIRHHDQLYYGDARPEITDTQYDEIVRRLGELEAQHPELIMPDSPTQRVGAAPLKGFAQVRHALPMISIDNTYTPGELVAFDARVRKLLLAAGVSEFEYVCEPKIDGVSLSLRYEKGKLVQAATRGDGAAGDDVTVNVRTIKSIPLSLELGVRSEGPFAMPAAVPPVVEIRGEVFLTRQQFALMNQQQEEAGEEAYANPRNTAAGTLKLLDSRTVAARKLRFLPHGQGAVEGFEFTSYRQWLAFVAAVGFGQPPNIAACSTIDAVQQFIESFAQQRRNLPFDTDGVVVKIDSFAQRQVLGATARAPRWCIAFKYQPEQARTELARVVFQVGKTGTITPVAEFEPPVFISGTKVYRASLHNFDEIARKDLRLHDQVLVEKAGEIIPYVVGNVPEARPAHARAIVPPEQCPACHVATERDGGFVRCTNSNCPEKLAQKLRYFGGRNQMDIENLGPAIVEQLMQAGLVKRLPDLYRLDRTAVAALDRMGEKSADGLLTGIEASKARGLERLLASLGILHVGTRTAVDIARAFPTLDELAAAGMEQFQAIDGVGDVVAQSVWSFLHEQGGLELLRELQALGVSTDAATSAAAVGVGPLAGKTIVVTGTLERFSRSEIKAAIERHGGISSDSVSKATSFVVAGAEAGSKLAKAGKLGIEVIDEAEFLRRIGQPAA
ncbi:MAG: NAD-dependent DNA ligase LigA [Phycisphaerales bacterium]|nr:NAD-dependent DNA ligase LigA [Phycisphaerales bacterium]